MLKAPHPPRGLCPEGEPWHLMEGLEEEKAVGRDAIHVFNGHRASRSKLETTGDGCKGESSVSRTERRKDLFGSTNSQDLFPHALNIHTF